MKPNFPFQLNRLLNRSAFRRGTLFGVILLMALLAFEAFNFSTTEFALGDLLGSDLRFAGIRWSMILAVAFCGIDFAGIARLFTPEQGRNEPAEVWYLFGAWLLAAAMNAALTWWGVATAVRSHALTGPVTDRETLAKVIPVFVAVIVWLIRVLVIGTFSMAGERLFSMAEDRPAMLSAIARPNSAASAPRASGLSRPRRPLPAVGRPAPKPEPGYHPVGISASGREANREVRS